MDTLLPLKQRLMQINCDTREWTLQMKLAYRTYLSVTVRLQIHRNFFARAIIDHPENPLKSPFAPSFMTAFNMATNILKEFHNYSEASLPLLLRMWPYWLHMLVSGVRVSCYILHCVLIESNIRQLLALSPPAVPLSTLLHPPSHLWKFQQWLSSKGSNILLQQMAQ